MAAPMMAATPARFLESIAAWKREARKRTTSSWPAIEAASSGVSPALLREGEPSDSWPASTR